MAKKWRGVLLLLLCASALRVHSSQEPPGQAPRQSPANAPLPAGEPPFPVNVSGDYQGRWHREAMDVGLQDVAWLQEDSGQVIFQLESSQTSVKGVHDVRGELVLKDGLYMTEEATVFDLEGVYVAATGQLHVQAAPAGGPLRLLLNTSDAGAVEHLPEYRKALRDKASLWATPPAVYFFNREDEVEYYSRMEKECAFALDLGVRSAPLPQEDDEQAGAPAAGGTTAGGDIPAGGMRRQRRRLAAAEEALLGSRGDAALVGPAGALEEAGMQAPGRQPRGGDLQLNGTLRSASCGLVIRIGAATTHLAEHYAKAMRYTACMTALTLLQILLVMRQTDAAHTQALASKVSLLTLGQQAILDAHLCLVHLTTGIMVEPVFTAFATAAFFEFALFAVFEMRYLLHAWRARRDPGQDVWAQQRELSVLYARFYGALLGGVFLSFQLRRIAKALTFAAMGFWVPQIVHCARHNARQPLRPPYVLGMSLTRLALPLYLFGCPRNVLHVGHAPALCVVLCVWMALQAGLLLSQQRYGPRWFVPTRFLPPKYDYHRRAAPHPAAAAEAGEGAAAVGPRDIETGDAGTECVICMNPLDVEQLKQRMVTPCGHFFHEACLRRWMDIKMECPTCRQPLPEI